MKLTINTEKFKEMISKAVKGASDDKLIPITQFMAIEVNGANLVLITTDATNYLYVSEAIDGSSDFSVTVFVDQFSKLISRMTSKDISLEIKDSVLEVSGNGTYSIELPLDENGELIKYPSPIASFKAKKWETIKLSDIKTVLDVVKPSLATDTSTSKSNPAIANYFVGDKVLATDSYKIASFDTKLFNTEYLVSPELMDLIGSASSDTIKYCIQGDAILLDANDIQIYGRLIAADYPVDVLESLLTEKFPSVCTVNKNEFLNLLDRMSLFVSKYDERAIKLHFSKSGIDVTNKAGKSIETIAYQSVKKHKDFSCIIDIGFLTEQIKAYASDAVELHYGRENSIRLVDGSITQIIALNM